MNGMIDDILGLSIPSFKDLVEARIFLELKGVKLAALRRTTDDLIHLENTLADIYLTGNSYRMLKQC